mmetsp:Transcript_713/g.2028  ORF Transcript_713/g.2028 Transcript_713/m.2028 type:complete len:203 (-) Transcript_713:609-1217(-)
MGAFFPYAVHATHRVSATVSQRVLTMYPSPPPSSLSHDSLGQQHKPAASEATLRGALGSTSPTCRGMDTLGPHDQGPPHGSGRPHPHRAVVAIRACGAGPPQSRHSGTQPISVRHWAASLPLPNRASTAASNSASLTLSRSAGLVVDRISCGQCVVVTPATKACRRRRRTERLALARGVMQMYTTSRSIWSVGHPSSAVGVI